MIDLHIDCSNLMFHLSVFHVQIDDMRPAARFPVILVGTESGLNSHLRNHVVGDSFATSISPVPYIDLNFTGSDQNEYQLTLKSLDLKFSNTTCKLDVDMLMRVVGLIGKFTQPSKDNVLEHQIMVDKLLNLQLSAIVKSAQDNSSSNSRFIEHIKNQSYFRSIRGKHIHQSSSHSVY